MNTVLNLVNTLYSFQNHNGPFILFSLGIMLCFFSLIFRKPSKYYVALLLGFLVLLFEFEYTKHLIPHVIENVSNPILVDPTRRAYGLSEIFFDSLLPLFMRCFGWLLIFAAIFSKKE